MVANMDSKFAGHFPKRLFTLLPLADDRRLLDMGSRRWSLVVGFRPSVVGR
jgi:hypothetical protein